MATFHSRSVRESQENVMGDASDKKEVQEQACYGLYGFLPMLTAQRKTKPRLSMGKAKRATLTAALSDWLMGHICHQFLVFTIWISK